MKKTKEKKSACTKFLNANDGLKLAFQRITCVMETRVAQIWEILEMLTSLGGSIFHLEHMKIKKYFFENLIYFCYPPPPRRHPIFPITSQWALFVECDLAPKTSRKLTIP